MIDELQPVGLLNAAALLIYTSKYDRGLSALLHDELHWFDIPSECSASLPFIVVFGVKHRCTHSPTSACQSPTLLAAGTCDPPAAIN